MRFLADENFPLPSVIELREADHDVASIIQDSPGASDQAIMARAVREERIVLTFDRDFGELVYRLRLPPPPGVVYFRFEPRSPTEPVRYLIGLLSQEGCSLERKFTVVDVGQIRQRPLSR